MPFRVTQASLSRGVSKVVVAPWALARDEKSVGGQVRFVPALTESVGWPQPPQKGFRAFQSSNARAWAYIAAIPEISIYLSSCWDMEYLLARSTSYVPSPQ